MKTTVILLLSVVMLSFACKHSKDAQKTTTTDTYRLIVSFISKGEGTDAATRAAMESLITTFSNRDGFIVKYDKYTWGREGEADYCFKMDGMKKAKQQEFVDSIKNVTKDSKLVIITENAVCSHKK